MDVVSPIGVGIQGANISPRTIDNIDNGGLLIERVEDLSVQSIFRLVVARPSPTQSTAPQAVARKPDT